MFFRRPHLIFNEENHIHRDLIYFAVARTKDKVSRKQFRHDKNVSLKFSLTPTKKIKYCHLNPFEYAFV